MRKLLFDRYLAKGRFLWALLNLQNRLRMKFNFTHKKELFTLLAACLLFAMQPLMAQEFWSEDFSGGMPAGWTNTDASSAAGEEVTFVHSTNPLDVAAAALGAAEGAEFLSATASNGYVWANSDRGLACLLYTSPSPRDS